jgi:hypothetical protein
MATSPEPLRGAAKRNAARAHCVKGHPYSGDNLRVRYGKWRACRICQRAREEAYRQRRKLGLVCPVKHNRHKTHCPRGHPLSGDNLFVNNQGGRVCRTCKRAQCKAAYGRRKQREALRYRQTVFNEDEAAEYRRRIFEKVERRVA